MSLDLLSWISLKYLQKVQAIPSHKKIIERNSDKTPIKDKRQDVKRHTCGKAIFVCFHKNANKIFYGSTQYYSIYIQYYISHNHVRWSDGDGEQAKVGDKKEEEKS